MKLNELDIQEKEFDLFVALDDRAKIQFLADAAEMGVEGACVKQLTKLAEQYLEPKRPIISTEDYQVGAFRLCVTSVQDELYLNSNSLKAIRRFVAKLFNDGLILTRLDKKKTEFDIYRYFRAYKIIGNVGPISSN